MINLKTYFVVVFIGLLTSCYSCKTKIVVPSFLDAKEIVWLNQLIYKDSTRSAFAKHAQGYEVVFLPGAVNGNYAIIAKNKTQEQYALIIRGSVLEFTGDGFQNFILQDFNVFKIKPWNYTDTVKNAYLSNGTWIGFQNLLQLKDRSSGLGLKEFIDKNIPANASIVIAGHSLGGNLAYPLAGYLNNEWPAGKMKNLQLITFGAPAAGNAAFVQDMEEKFPNAERYAASKDIATVFPDHAKVGALAKMLGLDTVLKFDRIIINGVNTGIDGGVLLNITGEMLEQTNLVNKTNTYVQSQKHFRPLISADLNAADTGLTIESIFNRAYQCHKIDAYAKLLGAKLLE